MKHIFINGHVFTGETVLPHHAVIVENGRILQVIPQEQLDNSQLNEIEPDARFDLNDEILAPGFIDLQVNGGGGVMFNNSPNLSGIQTIAKAHAQYGTTALLPTLITDNYDVMKQAVNAVNQAIKNNINSIIGIHLEGPFLNSEKKGAHDAEKFCAIDEQGFNIINSISDGKTLITIAPELTTLVMINRICEKGIIVCAGHSAANFEQTNSALSAGVTGFTHLYNAMTPLLSREPGMVGAALNDEHSWFGIIADGYHMHPAAFRVAITAKQTGGAILVTDAMATVGSTDNSFVLDGETIFAVDGRCTNAAGSLAGSDLNMNTAVKNAIKFARINWKEAIRMATVYPAKAIGIDHEMGYIKPHYHANFVSLDKNHNVTNTWIQGQSISDYYQ